MAAPAMRRVFSSHVDAIGYDEETGELHVSFQPGRGDVGRTAIYQGVPVNVARDVMAAPSIGMALHQSIRGKFPFGYRAGR
jgi:KTSC domain